MKKTRFLVLALAVAVMLMGAGYAWWTEQVVIQADVSTGELNVAIDDVSATADAWISTGSAIGVSNGIDQVKFNFSKLYPGSEGNAVITIKNTGSLQVKVDSPILAYGDGDVGNNWSDIFVLDDVVFTPSLNGVDGTPINLVKQTDYFGNISYKFDEVNTPVLLDPGKSAKFSLKVKMLGPQSTEITAPENSDGVWFTFTPTFKQFNAPN